MCICHANWYKSGFQIFNKYFSQVHENFKKWALFDDVYQLELSDSEMTYMKKHFHGKIIEGRFGFCVKCNNIHLGLWSSKDKMTLSLIAKDIATYLFPNYQMTKCLSLEESWKANISMTLLFTTHLIQC